MEDISIWQKTGHFYFALTPPRRNTEEFVLQDGTQQQASRRPFGNGTKYVTFEKKKKRNEKWL